MDTSNQPGAGAPMGQEPQDPYGGGYQPPPPPPPKKKGFNWLACCGISCLVVIIIGALMAWGCYRMAKPFLDIGITLAAMQETVSSTDINTIRGTATPITVSELSVDPSSHESQWLALEGKVITPGASSSAFSSGEFSTEDSTQYFLEGNILVMDISMAPRVAVAGDTIRAYGQMYAWDMSDMEKMPFVGKYIAEEMKRDPSLSGSSQMVFFLAKEVERVDDAEAEAAE